MMAWNTGVNASCKLCNDPLESRDHLFFTCSYSSTIWSSLTKGLLRAKYSSQWNKVIDLISDSRQPKLYLFLVRYVFQTTVHTIWRERNSRNHGEEPTPPHKLVQHIDKQIRNRLSSIRGKVPELDEETPKRNDHDEKERLLLDHDTRVDD